MNISLVASLLFVQSLVLLPSRATMENPSVVSKVPPKLQKDYQKLWSRFMAGNADSQVMKGLDDLVKKQKTFDPALTVQGYIELYRGDDAAAARKFEQAMMVNSANRIAVYYLAELAYAHQDYARANRLYSMLLSLDSSRSDVEPKRQKALLLAVDQLLRSAASAENESRLQEAEQVYKQALMIVPDDPTLHLRLAGLLSKENKVDAAVAERKRAEELSPPAAGIAPNASLPKTDDLEELGRWGGDINIFRQIQSAPAVTREQLAAVVVRYFPQLAERPQFPQIVTDVEASWARPEIQTVIGLGLIDVFPNHTFEPRSPVTRGEFATTLARLIRILGLSSRAAAPIPISDVASTTAGYADIQLVVAQGLMTTGNSGEFGISDSVSGQNAVQAAQRLLRSFQQLQR